ncbi:MAG: carboxypeptidase-like regulatory domain-containing protein [Gemmatimonadaceae bacterium]|nr:carboxypeptidase-like regulatory domain-containing protein [Gemmatimonadaceae bacterium]
MTVRPKGDWRPNTAYTITVLPGIGDLRNQPSPYGFVLRFSTGGSIPQTALRGVAFDWVAGRAVAKTTIQAIDVKDTTVIYLTAADSTGRFELSAVPPGQYRLRAIDERTANRSLEPREPWDTATVTLTDSARADLYMFVHDTVPVRIAELRLNDSVTIALVMDKPLLPGVPIPVSAARVVTSDSTVLEIASVLTAAEERRAREVADSIARAKDTTQRAPEPTGPPRRTIDPTRRRDTVTAEPPPMPRRAPPTTDLVLKLRAPLATGATYRVTLTGLRNLMNVEGTATRLLIVPKPAPIDSARVQPRGGRDSTARDSTRRDSTRRDSTGRVIPAPVRPPASAGRPPR